MKIQDLSPDLILSNGQIYTMDGPDMATGNIDQAVAVKDIQVDLTVEDGQVVWDRGGAAERTPPAGQA